MSTRSFSSVGNAIVFPFSVCITRTGDLDFNGNITSGLTELVIDKCVPLSDQRIFWKPLSERVCATGFLQILFGFQKIVVLIELMDSKLIDPVYIPYTIPGLPVSFGKNCRKLFHLFIGGRNINRLGLKGIPASPDFLNDLIFLDHKSSSHIRWGYTNPLFNNRMKCWGYLNPSA